MLVLQTFRPAFGLLATSPFAAKADALLAMSGLPYAREYPDVRKAPRGKLPVLVDESKVIPDSAHIQRYLETAHGIDFDGDMTVEQRAVATAFRRLVEHHLYFINTYLRWNDTGDAVRDEYFAEVPGLLRNFVFNQVRKRVNRTLDLQGLSRHSRDQMLAFAYEDVNAIAAQLGSKPFMLGERATSLDATVWAAISNLIDCTLPSPVGEHAKGHANLVAYNEHCRETFYPGGFDA